jgi:tetratricopeptide (TPR) repeat protein
MLPFLALLFATAADPAYSTFDQAYTALRARDYDEAISLFRAGLAISPHRNDIRKDLAYTLLKTGEPAAAREHFAEVARRNPGDFDSLLEQAFLAYETSQRREARLLFDRVRKTAPEPARSTAERAFRNVDGGLAEGMARWKEVAVREPDNYSARCELGRLAEERNEWELAASNLAQAWRIRKTDRKILLDLGRAYRSTGRNEHAMAALLAASRGNQSRWAEAARSLLPKRYPFVYEFQLAVELDPENPDLRRELAYLHLEMKEGAMAEAEFGAIVERRPDDLLSQAQLGFLKLQRQDRSAALVHLQRVLDANAEDELTDRVLAALGMPRRLRRPDTPRRDLFAEAVAMAEKSYTAGYLKDALRYLTIAHEHDPADFKVILELARTENMLKNDRAAMQWFAAARAWRNLAPQFARFRTSFWALPFYSSRWKDVFSYAQAKVEWNLAASPVRPYLSVRFIGDLRQQVRVPYPGYLTETAVIPAAGLATKPFRGAFAWAEAGAAASYIRREDQAQRIRADYRAGVSYSMVKGRQSYVEHHDDLVYISRFGKNGLLYSQNKFGRVVRDDLRVYWNVNLTADTARQYWANFAETGPGIRWKRYSLDWVRGAYLINRANPRGPNYTDLRAGIWYAR